MKNARINHALLERARMLRGLRLTELAAQVGLGEDMLRKILNGTRQPGEKTAFALARVLEVPMSQLLIFKNGRKRSA